MLILSLLVQTIIFIIKSLTIMIHFIINYFKYLYFNYSIYLNSKIMLKSIHYFILLINLSFIIIANFLIKKFIFIYLIAQIPNFFFLIIIIFLFQIFLFYHLIFFRFITTNLAINLFLKQLKYNFMLRVNIFLVTYYIKFNLLYVI